MSSAPRDSRSTQGFSAASLGDDGREALLRAPRPRRDLPLVAAGPRRLPLAPEARTVDRATRPAYAVWEITLACDLACRHCGSRAGRARPDELSTAECLDVIDQLAELGVGELIFIGGEVYLRDDWLELLRHTKKLGILPLITTGGRGFDLERARAASEAGVSSVSVSLDGTQPTHDHLRGLQGSHAAALAALRNLRASSVPITVNTQINRLSMNELHRVLDTVLEEGAESWQIQLTVPMGRAADEPEIILQPYDLLALFPIVNELAERCRANGILLWPANNVGYFGPYESILRSFMPRAHHGGCGMGRSGLGIESDGTVKGCPSLATSVWAAGTVREHRLKDLWERSEKMRFARDRTPSELRGFCKTCYYAEDCMAGCTWTAESILGVWGDNPYCHHRALERQREGLRERLVHRDPAKGEPFDFGRFELVVEPA
ncbi:MAG: radical SAM protein [Polyangiaceae bacterium]